MNYIRVRLLRVPSFREGEVASYCISHGSMGLSEDLSYSQLDLADGPEIIFSRAHDIDVYFESCPEERFFLGLKELVPSVQWEILEEENKDWLLEWKKGFVPFQLAGPFWVVPSWEPSPVSSEFTITMDPGMAFGTGTHVTTRMASYFVHKLCSRLENPKKIRFLDVGTGTGILAMLAKKYGVGQVMGIDIDFEARRVARENIKLNELTSIEIPEISLEELTKQEENGGRFDAVVANIVDGVLVQMKPYLLRLLRPGGQLFLTGILLEREEFFLRNFCEEESVKTVRRLEEDEWVGYWLEMIKNKPQEEVK